MPTKKHRIYNLRRQKKTGFMIKSDKNYIFYVLRRQNIQILLFMSTKNGFYVKRRQKYKSVVNHRQIIKI